MDRADGRQEQLEVGGICVPLLLPLISLCSCCTYKIKPPFGNFPLPGVSLQCGDEQSEFGPSNCVLYTYLDICFIFHRTASNLATAHVFRKILHTDKVVFTILPSATVGRAGRICARILCTHPARDSFSAETLERMTSARVQAHDFLAMVHVEHVL
ncbi:hypothetical protein NDU88_009107 [Pleurodeles waltl]|uniref:Uncharacterized protein n=1 Tax=Pleurodeles waltl TaxID=8319 RepID=A0AAV7RXL8_PLEWA|nr:hypothetical protein NDU88_009107 [Pleurodeles waltl]